MGLSVRGSTARGRAAERRRVEREMEDEMQREFTLIIKPPNQGRGFAGKSAKRFEIKTNFGAILHDVVKSAYEKDQGKKHAPRVSVSLCNDGCAG